MKLCGFLPNLKMYALSMNRKSIYRTYVLLNSRKVKLKPVLVLGLVFMFLMGSLDGFTQVENQPANQAETQLEPFLLLEKPGTKKRYRYYIGDEVEFKLKDEKGFHKGTIVQFSDTSFYVNEFIEIPLRTVEALADRSKVNAARGIAATAFSVIPVFFVLSAANNLFNTGDTPIIDKEVYPLSAVFLGIGGLGMLYKGRRYRLKNRWRIIMVRL